MSPPRSVPLVPLVCPSCHGPLPALEEDTALACLACRRAYELRGEELAAVPLRLLPLPARPGFHLPFWSFAGGVVVPAFNTREVLPLTRRFSGRPLTGEEGEAPALVGASLAAAEAWRVAELAEVCAAGSPRPPASLLGLPFLDEGNRLLDLTTGLHLYKETIDRADSLVRANRGAAPDPA